MKLISGCFAILVLLRGNCLAATALAGLTDESLRQVQVECNKRCEEFFRKQAGKPLVKAAIQKDWRNRGDFTRHYNQSIVLFATRAFYLNEQVEEANRALREMCQYHLDRPQTLLEIHSFPDCPRQLVKLCQLYGPNGSRTQGLISDETYQVILKTIWTWASAKSKVAAAELKESQTWIVTDSENHHANHFASCWAVSMFLAGEPGYRDRRFEDGHTAREHYDAWTAYLREYYRQRGRKGMTVEIDSPSYASTTLGAAYWLYDLASDPVLKRRAGDYITLFWALWAEQQFDGVSGGAKTRCYPKHSQHGNDFIRSAAWYVMGVGDPEFEHLSMLPFITSSWRMPDVVRDIALDSNGRGDYEVQERHPGLVRSGSHPQHEYHLRSDFGGILRYSYCTPDFIMGSLLCEARPADEWSLISSQNRWYGIVFRGAIDARIYPYCEPAEDNSYNQQWAVQHKGTLIAQKLKTSVDAKGLRVWFSKEGLTQPVKEGAWFFAEASDAWAAVRVVSGEAEFLKEPPASGKKKPRKKSAEAEEVFSSASGWVLKCSDDFSPVIIEVARKMDCKTFEAFRKAVTDLPLKSEHGKLAYNGLGGDRFTFFTDQSQPPQINGQPVNYAPAKVYDSPFVQSDWDSGVVTIQKGGRKLTLDFNAAEPPPHSAVGQRFVPADVDWEHPVYVTAFDNAAALKDWKLEGGKRMSIENGKFVLESEPGDKSISEALHNHLVCWLTNEMPADFLLEFKVRPQNRKQGLNIVFFNARGVRGESIFDPVLKSRTGIFAQYHSGDLNNYHISYWAAERGTANVRKNAGFKLVATGKDLITAAPADAFQTVRLYKRGGTIRLMVDDIVAVAFDDDGRTYGEAWTHPGWIGLRQMAHTIRCEYDDLKIFPCKS